MFVVYVAFVPLLALTVQIGHQLADRAALVHLRTVQYVNHLAQRVVWVSFRSAWVGGVSLELKRAQKPEVQK